MATVELHDIVQELATEPVAAQAISSIGGSHRRMTEGARIQETALVWALLHGGEAANAPPPAASPTPDHLGPFTWSPIVFGGGVPVGGWAQLGLFANGAFNFTGHFHDSGTPSYDMSCVFAVRGDDGNVYTFAHRGRTHGTFESGSRDDDWGDSGTNVALAAGWPALVRAVSWHANAAANADFGQLLDQTVKAVGEAAAVIAVVA